MRFTTLAVVFGLVTLETVTAAPTAYTSPHIRPFRKVYLRPVPCGQQTTPCFPNTRTFILPTAPVAKVPLLRQVFTTVTKKHDSLNTAQAENGKGLNVKYQAGPSLELEGSADASEYDQDKEAEHSDNDSSYPYVYMQPDQELQYAEPAEETDQRRPSAWRTAQSNLPRLKLRKKLNAWRIAKSDIWIDPSTINTVIYDPWW
ncbi:hypothetical protein K493DRAFT_300242 [Basidiobolus meristosporus CBS 931.73]|uniref:Uncharacterized protein n=1 Tax=Basidiobolus meristosporus CBS 931.73 TaxID=1314790 RepID=A0A1Y1YIN8_9FUNG|nr:hypothetical protein K493DRAFT_300242 [Basidiobolus meristosporus CBS 931.73]|eukprot:ORX97845.1 hypothetical protein K493DRAFT_300242 [Basidiobolus meristosporus CBS 931.73]